jgi:ATP-dependent helicase HrpB
LIRDDFAHQVVKMVPDRRRRTASGPDWQDRRVSSPRALLPPPGHAETDLPVRPALAEVTAALNRAGCCVLVAPPGTGKTTVLPLALADHIALVARLDRTAGSTLDDARRVIVAEPRRIATRAAARRMAALLGERVGDRIGYAVRGERVTSARTRIEVVTTGLLVQRLQADPELHGTAAVIIDECHERHLDSDLALAFCVDIRQNLRDDLLLVATSATAATARIAATLGGGDTSAPVVETADASHPVEVVWAAPRRPLPLLRDARVDPRLLDHVAATITRAVHEAPGDVLAFLPGEYEVQSVSRRLHLDDAEVFTLFGRQSAAVQDRVLRPGRPGTRRVVLSTALAESSLTVPGVRIVVDAGLSREPRTDHARGLSRLTTTRVSRASAEQRAGRAGREAAGRVYRCWTEAEHANLAAHAQPEIAIADLTGFALAVARWGQPRGVGLALPDRPPVAALERAEQTLRSLGAVGPDGRITARGDVLARAGVHPRLARALVDGTAAVGVRRAREVVAMLAEDGAAGRSDDLVTGWRRLLAGDDAAASARWRAEIERLTRAPTAGPAAEPGAQDRVPSAPGGRSASRESGIPDDRAAAMVVGLAFPERVARLRPGSRTSYLMAGGTGAELEADSVLAGHPWLAIAVADRPSGATDARIRLAAACDEGTARKVAEGLATRSDEIRWIDSELRLRSVSRLGAIVLSEHRLRHPDPAAVLSAVHDGLQSEGLELLAWSADARSLRTRLWFCHDTIGAPWPPVDDTALLADLDGWLGPDLAAVRSRADLATIDAGRALRRLLPWPQGAELDDLAPDRLTVASGSRPKLRYEVGAAPVLAVKLQELFGSTEVPPVAGGRVAVVLELLSPAGRPVAVTADLESFWRTGYPQVRAELRGRYPRHPWPEKPGTAQPTRRVQPRR